MTRSAAVIRHIHFEDLGVLAPVLAERGYEVHYLDAGMDPVQGGPVDDADLLVVLGGPIGVGDVARYPLLTDELEAIREWIVAGRPVLGICLGAQLVAAALGASVGPTGRAEIGYVPLRLTPEAAASPLADLDGVPALHWHMDAFEIPAGAVRLAETPGFPNQAFTHGSNVLALQFHLEVDYTQIEKWLIAYAPELNAHGRDPQRIRDDARRHGPALEEHAETVIGGWLDGLPKTAPGATPAGQERARLLAQWQGHQSSAASTFLQTD